MRCIRQWIVRHRDTVDHARGHVIVFVIPGYGNNSGIPQSFDDGQFFRYWSKPGIGNSLAWPLRFSKFLTQGDRTWNMTFIIIAAIVGAGLIQRLLSRV